MKQTWIPDLRYYLPADRVKLVHSGEDYFATARHLIDGAQEEVHVQVYIFEYDATGREITESLLQAASRGVRVAIVADAFGSSRFPGRIERMLAAKGIRVKRFAPVMSLWGIQPRRRLHHKIICADGKRALIGGINISDHYRGTRSHAPWLDFAVLIEGAACQRIAAICEQRWKKPAVMDSLKEMLQPATQPPEGSAIPVRIVENDWLRGKHQISSGYRMGIRRAKKTIRIVAGYFLPGLRERGILKEAARKGVTVELLLPRQSDVPIAKRATSHLYHWMLKHGFRVFEYKPSIVHGKLMCVDAMWTTIGSYNFNHLSDYGSIELNAEIYDRDFSSRCDAELQKIIATDCVEITREDLLKRSWLNQFMDWASYHLLRASESLLMLFGGREE